MAQSQFSLAWDSFKSNICTGFSALQQNGEFVDMTLAADGHFVKVHQVLIALSSSYLKDLIASAPCQHPVIFLNNISHKVLCFLLEYMYTGEVMVPAEYLEQFANAAQSLHVKGLENFIDLGHSKKSVNITNVPSSLDNSQISPSTGLKRKAPAEVDKVNLPSSARKVFIKTEGQIPVNQGEEDMSYDFCTDMLDDSGAQHSDDDFISDNRTQDGTSITDKLKTNASSLLYTVSIRGSLQVILNRYIYNLNSVTSRNGVRRWRCVDYRNNKCSAFVVTKGNIVMNRANPHNHPFHDRKILAKIEKKSVFSALDDVEAYRDKEKEMSNNDTVAEED